MVQQVYITQVYIMYNSHITYHHTNTCRHAYIGRESASVCVKSIAQYNYRDIGKCTHVNTCACVYAHVSVYVCRCLKVILLERHNARLVQ